MNTHGTTPFQSETISTLPLYTNAGGLAYTVELRVWAELLCVWLDAIVRHWMGYPQDIAP